MNATTSTSGAVAAQPTPSREELLGALYIVSGERLSFSSYYNATGNPVGGEATTSAWWHPLRDALKAFGAKFEHQNRPGALREALAAGRPAVFIDYSPDLAAELAADYPDGVVWQSTRNTSGKATTPDAAIDLILATELRRVTLDALRHDCARRDAEQRARQAAIAAERAKADAPHQARRLRLNALDARTAVETLDVDDGDEPIAYVVDELLPEQALAMLFGPSGAGKTAVALALAIAVCSGRNFAGAKVADGRVVWLALDGPRELKRRARAALQRWPEAQQALQVATAIPDLEDVDELDEWCATIDGRSQEPVQLLVVDTWADLLAVWGVPENDPSAAIAAVRRIGAYLGCVVLVLHHPGRVGEHERGSNKLRGACDVVVSVVQEEATPLGITVRLELSKGGRDGSKFRHRDRPERDVLMQFASEAPGKPLVFANEQVEALEVQSEPQQRDRAGSALTRAKAAARARAVVEALQQAAGNVLPIGDLALQTGIPRSSLIRVANGLVVKGSLRATQHAGENAYGLAKT